MQILLCEDDGIFFGGTPKNVILQVKFDDGKQIRIPFSADKSISTLYQDLQAIAPKVTESTQMALEPLSGFDPRHTAQIPDRAPDAILNANKDHSRKTSKDTSHIIEKEDFVTLIRLDEGRNKDASCDLQVGNEYRVLQVISTGVTLPGKNDITKIAQGYDVIDDSADRPERTRVFPHEVVLSRKRNPPPPMVEPRVEEILNCPTCNTPNACVLEDNQFKGLCESCNNEIAIKRLIKSCNTPKCGKSVSLFDNGTNFKGSCNQCKAVMEISYDQ